MILAKQEKHISKESKLLSEPSQSLLDLLKAEIERQQIVRKIRCRCDNLLRSDCVKNFRLNLVSSIMSQMLALSCDMLKTV